CTTSCFPGCCDLGWANPAGLSGGGRTIRACFADRPVMIHRLPRVGSSTGRDDSRRIFALLRHRGFRGADQAIAGGVESVERGARAEELAAGDIAVTVAIHPAKPVRALGGPRGGRG